MSRGRRRRRSGGGDGWKIGLGLLAGTLGAIGLGGLLVLGASIDRPPPLDAATLCPATDGGGPTAGAASRTVVLLDGSDALPPIAERQVTNALTALAEDLPVAGLLEVRLLDAVTPGGRVLFSRCNPGDGEGLSEWTANPQAARRRWLADFREPVAALVGGGVPAAPAEVSPIMATVQSIAVERFEGDGARDRPKRLVIVSDMLENTPDYSQYREPLDLPAFRASAAARKFATDLHGAEVTVYYISRDRSGEADSGAHIRFWEAWFADNGGRLVEAVKLQGVG
jgi:hypothetical protein